MAEAAAKVHDVIMIGGGPSSLAAAVYTTREDIETLILEKGVVGGLAAITDMVENYPGFPDGVSGLELADRLRKQAERFGTKIEYGEVTGIEDQGDIKIVKTADAQYRAHAILIATGNDYKKLDVKGETELYGRGVHYCATCDGPLYKGKDLVVVGGGNSAAQESLFLAHIVNHVDILIRKDQWKASDILVKRIQEAKNITVHFNTEVQEIIGQPDGLIDKVKVVNNKDNKTSELKADGIFIFVGLKPNTGFLAGSGVKLDDRGFVTTNSHLETNLKGIFCAGDVRSGATEQIASAVGEGAAAALTIREYLHNNPARKHMQDQPQAVHLES